MGDQRREVEQAMIEERLRIALGVEPPWVRAFRQRMIEAFGESGDGGLS